MDSEAIAVTPAEARAYGLSVNNARLVHGELRYEGAVALGSTECFGRIDIGAFTFVGNGSELWHCTIGRFCSIAARVIIGPAEHPVDWVSTHPFLYNGTKRFTPHAGYEAIVIGNRNPVHGKRTSIGHDVWVGDGAFLKQGISVGTGSVIAARSVVVKDVPPYSVVAGVPARVLRQRFPSPLQAALLDSAWWTRDLAPLRNLPWTDPNAFLEGLRSSESSVASYATYRVKSRKGSTLLDLNVLEPDKLARPVSVALREQEPKPRPRLRRWLARHTRAALAGLTRSRG